MWVHVPACVMVTKGIRVQVTPAGRLRLHLLLWHTDRLKDQTSRRRSRRGEDERANNWAQWWCEVPQFPLIKSLQSWTEYCYRTFCSVVTLNSGHSADTQKYTNSLNLCAVNFHCTKLISCSSSLCQMNHMKFISRSLISNWPKLAFTLFVINVKADIKSIFISCFQNAFLEICFVNCEAGRIKELM